MFERRDGWLSLFHEHSEILIPLIIIVVSVWFALYRFYVAAPVAIEPVATPGLPFYSQDGRFPFGYVEPSETGAAAPQPTPEPQASEAWIVSSEPSTFYVVQATELYSCPGYECDVVFTLYPGVYWKLPFTLAPDGWFKTRYSDGPERGFVPIARLSADMPGHCRLVLPYRIGHVGQRFVDEGFDVQRLRGFVLEAEKQIEDVIGRNVLSYEEGANNTVNFVITHYDDAEPGHRGLHTSNATFPNGTNGQFWVGIYAALFDDVDRWHAQGYISADQVESFKLNSIRKTILHEMVHTLGFGHLDDPATVMCGAPNCRIPAAHLSTELVLTDSDKTAIRSWCE